MVQQDLHSTDITITPALWGRPLRERDHEAEITTMRLLGEMVIKDPSAIFQTCVDAALKLCRADTCGISLYEHTPEGDEIFRWVALTGMLKQHLHGTTPRNFSPCGICVDTNAPLLMKRPELVYEYLNVGPPFEDALLIPLRGDGNDLEGTIWVLSHNTTHQFDAEDARTMQRIAVFISTVLRLAQIAERAQAGAADSDIRFRELDHRIKNTLQISAAILSRHLGAIIDPVARTAITSARRRMTVMGLAHVVRSDAAPDELAEIVRQACADMFGDDSIYRVEVRAEKGIRLSPAKASTVVLVVNELVTNALNHAFQGRNAGTVTVGLRRIEGDQLALTVTDDGVPMQSDHPSGKRTGLGLKIVEGLLTGIGGVLTVDPATKQFVATFPN